MPGGAPAGKRHAPNGAGSVYKETVKSKRADGSVYEYVRWVGSLTLPNGSRKRVVATTQRGATDKLNTLKGQHATGTAPSADRQTVGDYLTWWMENSLRCKPTTLATYEYIVRLYLIPRLGRIPVTKLQPEDVEKLMADHLRTRHSQAHANLVRAVLMQALNVLLRRRRITFNAAALVEPYKLERVEPDPMEAEECQRYLAALRDHRLGALFVLAMATGLRQGELLGLRWQDVDLDHARLTVRQNMQVIKGASGHLAPTPITPKSIRGRRGVPIPSFALERLLEHQAVQNDLRELAGLEWEEHDLVFPTHLGRPQYAAGLRTAFHRALASAGLPPMRFHNLRHVYQSLLVHLGIHPFVSAELMGHADTKSQMRYSHILDSAKVAAADALDALLRSP